jgi:hypothetical protein
VILLVGAFDPLDEQEARRVGADGVLKKPFVPPDPLIAMVTSALAKAPKPEVKPAPEPVAEIPKVAPPPPPPPNFPEPTPEEDAYMFGTGRRSLDDDDKVEAAAPVSGAASAPAAVQTAVDSAADEDLTFAGTRSDWRREQEVDFAAVPSFSAELVDAPAEPRPGSTVVRNGAPAVEARAESTLVEADPFAAHPETESKVETVVAPSLTESYAAAPLVETVDAPTQSIFESQAVVEPPAVVEAPAPAPVAAVVDVAPVVEVAAPEPVAEVEAQVSAVQPEIVVAAPVETFVAPFEPVVEAKIETPVARVETTVEQVEAPVARVEAPVEQIETPVAHVVPPPQTEPVVDTPQRLASVVETVTSPRKWLDFLMPSRTRSSEAPAESNASAPEAPVREEPVAEQPVASSEPETPVAAAPVAEATPVAAVHAPEPSVSEVQVSAPAAPEAPAAVSEAISASVRGETEILAQQAPVERQIEDSGQHWSEIASQLAAEAPLVEAAQSAMNAERPAAYEAPAPVFASPEPSAVEPPASFSSAPQVRSEEAAAPPVGVPVSESMAEVVERASSVSQAPPTPPNVDEVVAKILEKLGPQIQDLLAKGVVRPLVEDMLKQPDEKKK